jgi:hypothetical protein
MRLYLAVALATLSFCAACTSDDGTGTDASQLHFLTIGQGYSGLVAKVKQPVLRACTYNTPYAIDDGIPDATLKWIEPLRKLTSAKLTKKVEVSVNGKTGCDFYVVSRSGTHANTEVTENPVVNLDTDGYFASYNVLLHELGHAFALGDTYYNGQSGLCQPGQPQAVMCNTSFSALQPDDITGVQSIFKRTFPNDKPGPNGGGNDDVDDEDNGVGEDGPSAKLFAALGAKQGVDRYALQLSAVGGKSGAMEICVGDSEDCSPDTGDFVVTRLEKAVAGQARFSLRSVDVSQGLQLTLRYTPGDGGDPTYRSIAFKRAGG